MDGKEDKIYATCPTCNVVFETTTLYRAGRGAVPRDKISCIIHMDDYIGRYLDLKDGERKNIIKEVREATFEERINELRKMKSARYFDRWDNFRRASYENYAHSIFVGNRLTADFANHLLSLHILKKSLDSNVSLLFFEIVEKGVPIDIGKEKEYEIFNETMDRLRACSPGSVVEACGPSSQLTMVYPGTFNDLQQRLNDIIHGFNKKYSPRRRISAVGFNYDIRERPDEQLGKLHNAMRNLQNVKQITERAARAG